MALYFRTERTRTSTCANVLCAAGSSAGTNSLVVIAGTGGANP